MDKAALEIELQQVLERIEQLKAEIYRQDGVAGYLQQKIAALPTDTSIQTSNDVV